MSYRSKKKKSKFFEIFNPKRIVMDFARVTGWLPTQLVLRPRYHYHNTPKSRKIKGRVLLVCNHINWVDPALISIAYIKRRVYTVTAEDVMGTGWGYRFFRGIGCIPINREEPDLKSFGMIVDNLKKDRVVLIFPEGKIAHSDKEDLLPFKSGTTVLAIRTNAPIIPIYSAGNYKTFRRADIMIGKPINLKDHYDGLLTMENIESLTNLIQDRMNELKIVMTEIITNRSKKKRKDDDK